MKKRKAKAAPRGKRIMKSDPIFAAIAEHHRLEKIWCDHCHKLDVAQYKARKKYGQRPWSLIAWRNYSAIGGGEIDNARKEFLQGGVNRNLINKEYRDAKARERAAERAGKAWDRRTSTAQCHELVERATAAKRRADDRMAKTRPTTPAGAAVMLAYLRSDMKDGKVFWHDIALATLVSTLKAWGKGGRDAI
jgi:hypothetical protein